MRELRTVAVLGLGLLGGSVGLGAARAFGRVRRVGYSHRAGTRRRALEAGVVDEVRGTAAAAAGGADLVILASPMGTFPELMAEIRPAVGARAVVTDVGSTKVLPVRWAGKYLRGAEYVGSHPMAGSEQRGLEFARADLFEGRACIVTPTGQNRREAVRFVRRFWEALGMRVQEMGAAEHDRVLARISHLPHVLAAALVRSSALEEMLLCGKGFLDTTRIASGPVSVWRDILLANAGNTAGAIGRLTGELERMRRALERGDEKTVVRLLEEARAKRGELVARKLARHELPE